MIRLEYFTKEDFQQLINWINTEELLMNWSGRMFLFPLTEDSLDWYIKDTNNINEPDAFVYKAIDEAGNVVGHISLGGISTTNKNARINRVFVSPDARGRSICQQMVEAVLKIGFEKLKLHRIALGAYDSNKAAIKCYEKAGMKIEGINRHIFLYNGQYWSMVEMAMLEDEWFSMHQSNG
jgi:RimJ/RimL family protein N-acetyltransferase